MTDAERSKESQLQLQLDHMRIRTNGRGGGSAGSGSGSGSGSGASGGSINLVEGIASFVDPHTISVKFDSAPEMKISAERFVIATGSTPREVHQAPQHHFSSGAH